MKSTAKTLFDSWLKRYGPRWVDNEPDIIKDINKLMGERVQEFEHVALRSVQNVRDGGLEEGARLVELHYFEAIAQSEHAEDWLADKIRSHKSKP